MSDHDLLIEWVKAVPKFLLRNLARPLGRTPDDKVLRGVLLLDHLALSRARVFHMRQDDGIWIPISIERVLQLCPRLTIIQKFDDRVVHHGDYL